MEVIHAAESVEQKSNAEEIAKIRKQMLSPWKMKAYMMAKLPMGFLAGLRIRELTTGKCTVSVPYKWLNTNPFKSTYFAVLGMAAELSTGALSLMAAQLSEGSIATLITGLKADFVKKAVHVTNFTCEEGGKIFAAVEEASVTGVPTTATVKTTGRSAEGVVVAEFEFTWSFKKRS